VDIDRVALPAPDFGAYPDDEQQRVDAGKELEIGRSLVAVASERPSPW
jgi:hypothetical protein